MDSRFEIDVKFYIYGESFEWKASLNWSGTNGELDERISEWFRDCHDRALIKWSVKQDKANASHRAEQEKTAELAELSRLKLKYPENNP